MLNPKRIYLIIFGFIRMGEETVSFILSIIMYHSDAPQGEFS